jgi:hypothetical protein
MIFRFCAQQIDRYSFNIWNITSIQSYTDAGIDYTTFTDVELCFKKVNDVEENEVCITISDADFQFAFAEGGLTIDIADFPDGEFMECTYFLDWFYELTITYTYDSTEYTASNTVGFRDIILHIVYQQMLQSNWKKELACTCTCENWSSAIRKFNYLMMMDIAAENCLVNEYLTILSALYKLTGTINECSE